MPRIPYGTCSGVMVFSSPLHIPTLCRGTGHHSGVHLVGILPFFRHPTSPAKNPEPAGSHPRALRALAQLFVTPHRLPSPTPLKVADALCRRLSARKLASTATCISTQNNALSKVSPTGRRIFPDKSASNLTQLHTVILSSWTITYWISSDIIYVTRTPLPLPDLVSSIMKN
ncbi:hypothetical protein DL93DRAFT_1185290 [Clavulina sp. PMI_390]|nr:hypothetical protein DL93DRAFT_1185290 [Clavulina sp. PMI_390]